MLSFDHHKKVYNTNSTRKHNNPFSFKICSTGSQFQLRPKKATFHKRSDFQWGSINTPLESTAASTGPLSAVARTKTRKARSYRRFQRQSARESGRQGVSENERKPGAQKLSHRIKSSTFRSIRLAAKYGGRKSPRHFFDSCQPSPRR